MLAVGTRNDGLFREACRLHNSGLTGRQLADEVASLNVLKCQPPLPIKEVATLTRSAARYPVRHGRAGLADYEPLEAPLGRLRPWNPLAVLDRVLRDERAARYWHGDFSGVPGTTELARVSLACYRLCNKVAFESMRIGMEPTPSDVAGLVQRSAANVSKGILEPAAAEAVRWLNTGGWHDERQTRWSLLETDGEYAGVLAKAVARFDEPPTWYRLLKANKQSYPSRARRENVEVLAAANGSLIVGRFVKPSGRLQRRLLADFHLAKIASQPVLVEVDRQAELVKSLGKDDLYNLGEFDALSRILRDKLPPNLTDATSWNVMRAVAFARDGGLTRSELLRKVGYGRLSASRLDSILAVLLATGLFEISSQPGRGRPTIRFSLTQEARAMITALQESMLPEVATPVDDLAATIERLQAESEAEALVWRTVPQVTVMVKTDEDRFKVETAMQNYWHCRNGTHLVRFVDGEACRDAVVYDWLMKDLARWFAPKPASSEQPLAASRFALKPASETGPQFTSVKPAAKPEPAVSIAEPIVEAVAQENAPLFGCEATSQPVDPAFVLVTSDTQEAAKFRGAIDPFRFCPGRSLLVRLKLAGETMDFVTNADGVKRLVRFFGDVTPNASDVKPLRTMRLESEADRRARLAKLKTNNAKTESQAA